MEEKIAIDLLWLRPGKVGGTEFFIRNLLDGFLERTELFHFVLFATENNFKSFERYLKDKRFEMIIAPIDNSSIGHRIIWQNLFQNSYLRKNGIKKCFTPVYCRPMFNGKISYINVIHDIQAYHYPEYHPLYEVWFSKLCWLVDKFFTKHVVAISSFVKTDLLNVFHFSDEKVSVIYNPIVMNANECVPFAEVQEKYGIEEKGYYYTIGQLIPHKNIDTLVKVFDEIRREHKELPCRLLITGINGNAAETIKTLIHEYSLDDAITLTGFIEDEEKVALYKACKAFLFPSVFEGFGMPPIEAMLCKVPVITTKCACIPEVTQNKACYVEDPYDTGDWIKQMKMVSGSCEDINFKCYEKVNIAGDYLALFEKIWGQVY